MGNNLFNTQYNQPLSSRLRPRNLQEFFGQTHLISEGKILYQMIQSDALSSMIFWGPPGVGKTTLASIIAETTQSHFINFSAVTSGIKEIKQVMQEAANKSLYGQRTIVFIDEIHRFNKAQQDAFLPYVEKGSIILIGATTENPSFEVNAALLSRSKVFVLKALNEEELTSILRHACIDERGFPGLQVNISDEQLRIIARFANGDARTALNTLEMVVFNGNIQNGICEINQDILHQSIEQKALLYDKDGEEHYNIISALHKSMRNSDTDAAIYWLARMLEAGEDPLYVARRLVRFASEDIGMADSRALEICVAAYQACHYLGMPECNVHLTHAVVYLSLAPKSNACLMAYEQAREDAKKQLSQPVPLHLRNAVTNLMKDLDYGKGYQYAHAYEDKITTMTCLPDNLIGHTYYHPTNQGSEVKVQARMKQLAELRNQHKK